MDMKVYEGKSVYVKLNSGRVYSGKVKDVTFLGKDNSDIDVYMFCMTDKFGSLVCFSNKELNLLEEEK